MAGFGNPVRTLFVIAVGYLMSYCTFSYLDPRRYGIAEPKYVYTAPHRVR